MDEHEYVAKLFKFLGIGDKQCICSTFCHLAPSPQIYYS